MYRLLKEVVRGTLGRVLSAQGLVLVSTGHSGLGFHRDAALNILIKRDVDTILDIGANEGQFAQWMRSLGYTRRIVSFEPQPGPFSILAENCKKDSKWECYNVGLGASPGKAEMHISNWSVSSSLLPIGQHHLEIMPGAASITTTMVDIVRLDDWAEECRLLESAGKLFLKIDVQGYEIPVFRGGPTILNAVDGVLAELNFTDLYDGQSKYYEVMELLEDAGLRFVGLFDANLDPDTRAVRWGDGLFVRNER